MSWEPIRSIVRVLGPKRATAGTGTAGTGFFLTGGDGALIATCAHVIRDNVAAGPGKYVRIAVEPTRPDEKPTSARAYVDPAYWREPEAEDIAILRLEGSPTDRSAPLPLVPLLDDTHAHRSWGFPLAKSAEGLAASVTGLAPAMDAGRLALQGRSEEVSHGFSGAPVWDDESDVAIGMVMSIIGAEADIGGRQKTTFFIRPTEEIWRVCPEARGAPENPYRGLAVFEEGDAPLYHGRARAIDNLMARLAKADLVAVVGPSGSGKSSLVRAGLKKGLDATPVLGLATRPRLLVRPGSTPALDLVIAAAEHGSPGAIEARLGLSTGELRPGETVRDALGSRIRGLEPEVLAASVRGALSTGAILIIDQFERVFTDCPDEGARRHFAEALLAIASEEIKVLLTLRADFYGRVLELADLGAAVDRGQVTVLPMTHEELLDAVVEPARFQGRAFEPGLAEQLVDDVEGNAGNLPLLQLALTELWERDAPAGLMRKSTYEALGSYTAEGEPLRIRGVIAKIAEERWQRLDEDQRAAGTRLLLSLVAPARLGAGAGGTTQASRRIWRSDLDEAMRAVADDLVEARLLTTGSDPTTGTPTVEVAHEALIWAWPRLDRLAEKHASFVRWYDSDLVPFLRRWQEGGASPDLLLRGDGLTTAEQWLRTAPELLAASVAEFIERSVGQREEEAQRRRQEAERERERERALRTSESLRLASEAREATDAEPETAMLVAWEALLRDHNELSEAVFREALEHLPAPVRMLRQADGSGVALHLLADGTICAAATEEGSVEFWTRSGEPDGSFHAVGPGTMMVSAIPGSARLLTYRDEVLRLQDRSGKIVDSCKIPDAPPGRSYVSWGGLSVAENGTCLVHVEKQAWLVAVSTDSLTFLRTLNFIAEFPEDRERWEWDETLHQPMSRLMRATLEHHGEVILTEGDDGLRVWNLDGTLRFALDGLTRPADACILADGMVLGGSMGGQGVAWDGTGALRGEFREAANGRDLFIPAVDPSGRYAATTVNQSGVVEIRDATGQAVATLAGHEGHVWAVAFSPDGDVVATGGDDSVVRVWDWRRQQLRSRLPGHEGTVKGLLFHPEDPSTLISADGAGSVRLWQLEAAVIPRYVGHRGRLHSIQTTPVGVLSSGEDDTARVWRSTAQSDVLEGRLLAWTPALEGDRIFALLQLSGREVSVWELGRDDVRRLCSVSPWRNAPGAPKIDRGAVSADGRSFVVVGESSARLGAVSTGASHNVIGTNEPGVASTHDAVQGFGFSPDAARLVTAAQNGMVWLWMVDGRPAGSFLADTASPDRIFEVAVDPLGDLIATAVRQEVGLWSWDGERVGALKPHGYKVFTVTFSPDGGRIVTSADNPGGATSNVVELWDRSGELVAQLDANTNVMRSPIFDGEGRFMCMPSGRGVAVYDRDGNRLTTLIGARRTHATAIAIAPRGELIAVTFSDGVARLWSPETGRHRATLRVGAAEGLTFSLDGHELLVATPSGAIDRHALDVRDLFPLAANRLGRQLSRGELERFGIDRSVLQLDEARAGAPV
jgi:WD40 repeat protein